MSTFLARIGSGEILLADGAMGSLLIERGLKLGECPERLNLEQPETVREIAAAYLAAGADILQTNTFGGSPLKLAPYGLAEQTEAIQRAAVEAVRRAIHETREARAIDPARPVYIAGSCGPCGQMLEPYGDATAGEVRDSFGRQIRALIEAGIDVLCIETMTDLNEARLALEAAGEAQRSLSRDVPVMASMTFDATPRGFFTMMGNDIATVAAGLIEAGADLVGSNCGNGIANMVAIAQELRAVTDRPLLIQSNAGLPELEGEQAVYPEDPEFMADHVAALIEAGVQVIGGCCGTTPAHIRAFRQALEQRV